jgi:hypothetical protein
MELKSKQLNQAIELLKNADGEDLHFILKQIGMDAQILKQLIFSASELELLNCIEDNGRLKN